MGTTHEITHPKPTTVARIGTINAGTTEPTHNITLTKGSMGTTATRTTESTHNATLATETKIKSTGTAATRTTVYIHNATPPILTTKHPPAYRLPSWRLLHLLITLLLWLCPLRLPPIPHTHLPFLSPFLPFSFSPPTSQTLCPAPAPL